MSSPGRQPQRPRPTATGEKGPAAPRRRTKRRGPPRSTALRRFDLRRLGRGTATVLVGVDEAGRGAFAGPVVAAAVCLREDFYRNPRCRKATRSADDSKRLTPEARAELFAEVQQLCSEGLLQAAPGSATVDEIEERNVLGATRLAMARALLAVAEADPALGLARTGEETLGPGDLFTPPEEAGDPGSAPVEVLVDGRPLRPFPFVHNALVKGDGKSFAIAIASVVAKVTRDRQMLELDATFPAYGFAQHKGYGTTAHLAALRAVGPCPQHRPRFLRNLPADGGGGPQAEFEF